MPGDPLWTPHRCDCGRELGASQFTQYGTCIFFFLTCAWLTELTLNYWGLPTSHGEARNRMEVLSWIALGSILKTYFFLLLNSNHMQIEGTNLNEEETYRFKSLQLSFGPRFPPLGILCLYCLVNPHNKPSKSAPRFKDEKSKFQGYVALKHGRKIPFQPPCLWSNIKQYSH